MSEMFKGGEEGGMDDLEIDDLLQQLSPEELELLVGDVDPDDSLIPACDRISYKCKKEATGPLDRKKLINHINEQALAEPDRPELVPYVAGTVRGKKWAPAPPPQVEDENDDLIDNTNQGQDTVEVDMDDEMERVLNGATEDEIVDLAAVLGFHSMMNQEQYHASLLNKGKPMGMGWGGVTKATKFKPLPEEAPNTLDPVESIKKLKVDDKDTKDLNFNNIQNISDEQFHELFEALDGNTKLEVLSMSNTGISDRHIDQLCKSLQVNSVLKTLNLETNNLSPNGIVKIVDAIGKQHSVEEVRMANQRSSILGNKIEMQLTELIEANPTILRIGIHFEFNDSRNRVSRHLQKNLDTCESRSGVTRSRRTKKH